MNNHLNRVVIALILLPCLVADPITAAAFSAGPAPHVTPARAPVLGTQALMLTLGGALFATSITHPQAFVNVVHELRPYLNAVLTGAVLLVPLMAPQPSQKILSLTEAEVVNLGVPRSMAHAFDEQQLRVARKFAPVIDAFLSYALEALRGPAGNDFRWDLYPVPLIHEKLTGKDADKRRSLDPTAYILGHVAARLQYVLLKVRRPRYEMEGHVKDIEAVRNFFSLVARAQRGRSSGPAKPGASNSGSDTPRRRSVLNPIRKMAALSVSVMSGLHFGSPGIVRFRSMDGGEGGTHRRSRLISRIRQAA